MFYPTADSRQRHFPLHWRNWKKENIVFVGDTYSSDVKGANNAGIEVIWINHKGEPNKENLLVHSIGNTSELVEIVKSKFI